MNRASARPGSLFPLLLGSALLVLLLGWRLLGTTAGDPPASGQPVTLKGRTSRVQATASARGPGRGGDSGTTSFPHELSMPVLGVDPRTLHDNFAETRGGTRAHEAIDILAPRGTPVLAVDDGVVRRLFTSVPGGLTIYEFDLEERYCYYYAHLDGYAPGLHEGQRLRKGDPIGLVGTTGNAPRTTPHLHFAVSRLDADKRWWKGTPMDPYPLLVRAP